ncbi:MAG TPA: ABC transporter ATP-binding protein [Kiritimatiellia bacterium]|nr:ABC transporter ATP-binding protein [Kiritimatiellia bacterium]HMP33118.1 ABC transporter ATP-binding protein [Kiritimatiellia bacterium]
MTTAPATLELHGVERRFDTPSGPVTALRPTDLAIRPGEFVAISGPSGSGKTTLLHLAALLDRPTGGRLVFAGADTGTLDEAGLDALRRDRIGMVFQAFHLLPRRSVRDNIRFRFRYQRVDAATETARTDEAMAWVGIAHLADREARVLSGGEMQRVAIARAVAGRPDLLLADEPTGNLDQANTRAVMDCFTRLHAAGLTILMVTHNEALLGFATRRFHCADGTLEERR